MGFYRLIKKISRMVFRDFLFRIPKKYLVVVIMFLAIMLLKSNVFAYSNYDYIEVDDPVIDNVYYKYVKITSAFDTGVPAPYYIDSTDFRNNYQFELKCNFVQSGSWGYVFNNGELNSPDNFGLWYRNPTTSVFFGYFNRGNDLGSYSFGTDYEFNIFMYPVGGNTNPSYVVYSGNSVVSQGSLTMGTSQVNTSKNQTILLGVDNPIINFENFKIYTHNELSQDVLQVNLYPCKYRDTSSGSIVYLPGFYDVVSGNFIYFSNLVFSDDDILSTPPEEVIPPEPTPTPTPGVGLSNIDNSINNMNNFLQDNTLSNSSVNIVSPSVANSQIGNVADNIVGAFLGNFVNILNTDGESSVDIYIPNYISGTGQKFITIRGYLVRDFLSQTAVIPGLNITLLNVVQTLWSVAFGWWFFNIILGFINGIYSGEILSDEGLKKLAHSYTGVMANLL